MSTFVRKVRDGEIPHPTQRRFTLGKWDKAYEREADHSPAAERLYASGLWAFSHFEQLRDGRKGFGLEGTPPREQVRLAVAPPNRETYHVWREMVSGLPPTGFIVELAVQTTVKGNESGLEAAHPDTAVTVNVDGARFPVAEALGRAGERSPTVSLGDEEAVRWARANQMYGQLYSFIHGLWMQCLWNGCYIGGEVGGGFIMLPPEDGSAEMCAVSEFRRQTLSAAATHAAYDHWGALDEGARRAAASRLPQVTVKGSGKKRAYDVRVPPTVPDVAPASFVHRYYIERDFHRPLLDLPMPRYPRLTLRRVLDAWEVLASLAKALRGTLPVDTKYSTAANLLRYAPVVRRDQLTGLITRWLEVGPEVADEFIRFFTFAPGVGTELWACPLVREGKDRFTLLLAPLLQGNMPRTFDLWLGESGFDLTGKGLMFERYAREELRSMLADSAVVRDAGVRGSALKVPGVKGPEEIDLVLHLKNVVLLGEAKSQLFPSEPLEIYTYLETLKRGAGQIARKHEAVLRNRDFVLKELGLAGRFPADEVEFVPFVLTNHPLGVGHPIDGIPVTDLHTLRQFLRDGYWSPLTVRSGRVSTGVAELPFYQNEAQAAARVRDFLASPPQINLYWGYLKFEPVHYRFLPLGDMEFKRLECSVELTV